MRILVVEDEPKLNRGIVEGLRNRGYAVDFAFEGQAGETLARQHPYDLIILDIMLPRRDGLTVCRNLRSDTFTTPILLLTARDDTDDKVLGLDAGADDYVIKPFSFDELAARIRALLRRPSQNLPHILELDGLTLDAAAGTCMAQGRPVNLTLREFSLLEYLLRNTGRIVSRENILDHVWDNFSDSQSNVIDVHLKNLRKKLPAPYARRIETIRGKGYRLA
jgi:DNA-binding response OmpR family regulator